MTLETCKSIELLPHWMKEDVTDKTLCKINDDIVKEQILIADGRKLSYKQSDIKIVDGIGTDKQPFVLAK